MFINHDEELKIPTLQNGKYLVGTTHFYPHKLLKALHKLYESDEIKVFKSEADRQILIKKLKYLAPDEDQIKIIRELMAKEGEGIDSFSDEQISQASLDSFQRADDKVFLTRLKNKYVKWVFAAMMRNFETEVSNSFLRILSAAQMRAEKEIRKELGLPLPTTKEMKKYIEKPLRKTLNATLDISSGGIRSKSGFTWENEHNQKAFYEAFEKLPKIKNKDLWEHLFAIFKAGDEQSVINKGDRLEFNGLTELVKKAARRWENSRETERRITGEDSPRNFAFRHATKLLGFPEAEFSSFKKYYGKGKKLSESGDFQK